MGFVKELQVSGIFKLYGLRFNAFLAELILEGGLKFLVEI